MLASYSQSLQSAATFMFAAFLSGNSLWCQQTTQSSTGPTRTEHDLLGEKQVPADAYYGVQTLRALENFQLSGVPINHYPGFVEAWAYVKLAAAQANYDGTAEPYNGGGSKGEWRKATVPVDSFAANPWDLYNVHGNVGEWTEDCWNESNAANPGDGRARITGNCTRRVARGACWLDYPQVLHSASRFWGIAEGRDEIVGFRLARTLAP